MIGSPFATIVDRQGVAILDGGLSTQLESQGHDLDHPLWSARLLLEDPAALLTAHSAFLRAGADCIISASYQISVRGCEELGISDGRASELIAQSIRIACDARDQFAQQLGASSDRLPPIVAASVGPYGAALADGSEYSGAYGVSRAELGEFHASRWSALVGSGADILACETLPSLPEVEVLVDLLRKRPALPAWVSFSCRDENHICDGTPIEEAATIAANSPSVVAIGVNCTRPEYVPALIHRVRAAAPDHATVAYPNAGFRYDGETRVWVGEASGDDAVSFVRQATTWRDAGATLIGGCCGTGTKHIELLRAALVTP